MACFNLSNLTLISKDMPPSSLTLFKNILIASERLRLYTLNMILASSYARGATLIEACVLAGIIMFFIIFQTNYNIKYNPTE